MKKKPEDLLEERSLLLWDLDRELTIGAIKEFGRQCFEAAREEEHSQEYDWSTYKDFDDYLKKLYK